MAGSGDAGVLGGKPSVGTIALTGCAEVAWVASLFIPTPDGSGGMLGLLTPLVLAVITGVLGMAALTVLLVAGALLGRVIALLRHGPGDDRAGMPGVPH